MGTCGILSGTGRPGARYNGAPTAMAAAGLLVSEWLKFDCSRNCKGRDKAMKERARGIVYLLLLCVVALSHPFVPSVPWWGGARDLGNDRQWRAVAPGRVEPS